MKRYKKILMIWICAIVVVAVSVIVALYDNANQGQDVAKEVAVETLRKVAERVVNREFDGLGMFYAFGSDSGKKHTKRKAISENGEFEVIIDSLKEAQGLFPLDVVGFKADMLNYYGKFPLEEICLEWKAEMNDRYGGAMCALFLKVNPMGKGIVQESFTGDETIIASQNDLGTYYLNGMYTMTATFNNAFFIFVCFRLNASFYFLRNGTKEHIFILSTNLYKNIFANAPPQAPAGK